jgi:hypothetical protein
VGVTITSSFSTIANSIAGLNISGVTIKDIDEVPQSAQMLCPLLIPRPNDYITELTATRQSFGGGGSAKLNLSYTLNYVYLHAETGSGISQLDIYSGMITKLSAIIVAILTNDAITGLVDLELQTITDIGTIQDPSGNNYWGAIFALKVLEFAQ